MLPRNLPELIDADRRQVERRALAVLASAFATARVHAYSAARVGADPVKAVYDVLLGTWDGLPGLAPRLAPVLADAEAIGYRRTILVIPEPLALAASPHKGYRSARDYGAYAREAAGRMAASVGRKVSEAVGGAKRGFRSVLDALRGVFSKGYGPENPAVLRTVAETLVNDSYQAGYLRGFADRPEAAATVKGFRYVATLDPATTVICRAYHNVQLPVGSDWLRSHWPQNHFGCRAVCVPILGDFAPTADPPWTPAPQAGFGIAPLFIGADVAA
jgi:hypothetical protein